MRSDHDVMTKLDRKLNFPKYGNVKDLSLRFRLCYKKRCLVFNSAIPCCRFFSDLFKEREELSLTDLRNDIESVKKGLNLPNKLVFKKIEEDIRNRMVSFSLKTKLCDLNNDRNSMIYLNKGIVYNLVPMEGTLLPTWKNVGSNHGYTEDELDSFCKLVQGEKTPTQRLLSLISAEEQSLPISAFIKKLKQIQRHDVVLIVEEWRDMKMASGKYADASNVADKKPGHLKLKDDYNRREELCTMLDSHTDEAINKLCTKFELSDQQCKYIMSEMLPCHAFFESLSISQPELSLQCLRHTIEQKFKHPNKAIFLEIEKDINSGSISYTLDAELGALIDDPEHWLHILTNLANNLLQSATAQLLPSWKNVASYHEYKADYIETFESKNKLIRSTAERFLSVLFAHNPFCSASDLAQSLQEIGRKDVSDVMTNEQSGAMVCYIM